MSFHPQTPQSPSQLSPGTSDLTISMTGSAAATTNTLPTPAHSVNGSSIPSEMVQDTVMGEDSTHKRKREVDDAGDRAQKKAHVENRNLGIADPNTDVGEKYLLCRTRKAPLYWFEMAAAAAAVVYARTFSHVACWRSFPLWSRGRVERLGFKLFAGSRHNLLTC